MEIKLYFGQKQHIFILSKYIQRYIIPLERVSAVLGSPNNYEFLKADRRGKLFNIVAETDESDTASVIPFKSGIRVFCKKTGSRGFSPVLFSPDPAHVVSGVMTVIAKHCDKPNISGYYLNAFWGYPVEPEPFTRNLPDSDLLRSMKFWEENCYLASAVSLDTSMLLLSVEDADKITVIEAALGLKFVSMGRVSLIKGHLDVSIEPSGKFFAFTRLP